MTTIFENFTDILGEPARYMVEISTTHKAWTPDGQIVKTTRVSSNSAGYWEVDLVPTDDLVPEGVLYKANGVEFAVPDNEINNRLKELFTGPPEDVDTNMLALHLQDHPIPTIEEIPDLRTELDGKSETHSHPYDPTGTASTAIDTHEGAANPHDQYLVQEDADNIQQAADAAIEARSRQLMAAVGNRAWAPIYDSCERNVAVNTSAYGMALDSGHIWALSPVGVTTHIFQYRPNGVLFADAGANNTPQSNACAVIAEPQPALTKWFEARLLGTSGNNWSRYLILGFVDKDNWLAVRVAHSNLSIDACVAGAISQLGIANANLSGGDYYAGHPVGTPYVARIETYSVHPQFSETTRAARFIYNGAVVLKVPLSEAHNSLLTHVNSRFGLMAARLTNYYGLRAGVHP